MLNEKLYGLNLFGDPVKPETTGPVADEFVVPPFSIFDTRGGDWKRRKIAWQKIGMKSEVGRDKGLTYNTEQIQNFDYYRAQKRVRKASTTQGTSIFDPVLCEVAYRWFCPENGQIIDPFAGGSVRGIVAAMLGRKYWGCDLRQEQIQENIKQGEDILSGNYPVWVSGDSLLTLPEAPKADFLFSCPPYGNLEVYSDDPADLSNMDFHAFIPAYRRIILKALSRLKNNRFACFVVGDFRDKKGFYRNFVSETITAFELCGAKLYNEAILLNQVGTAAMRVRKQFNASRKLCKIHQNVLIFCKGDSKQATEACGHIENN